MSWITTRSTPADDRGLTRELQEPHELRGFAVSSRGPLLGRDRVDLGQQHGEELFLWHGAVKLTFLENHALAATTGDADVGMARLGGPVHHAAHDRDRDR